MAIPFRIRGQQSAIPTLAPNVNRKVKRDFRLWVGLGLLLLSILTISHLISAAGARTFAVVLTQDVSAGKRLTLDDLELVKVALPSAENYFSSVDSAVGATTSSDMAAGELVPSALGQVIRSSDLRRVSLPIRAGHLPAISNGDRVDIWSTPSAEGLQVPGPPTLIVKDASVAESPAEFDPNSDTALSVLLPSAEVAKVITALRDGFIDVVVLQK